MIGMWWCWTLGLFLEPVRADIGANPPDSSLVSPARQRPVFRRPVSPQEDLQLLARQQERGSFDRIQWLTKIQLYSQLDELDRIVPLTDALVSIDPKVPEFWEARMIAAALNDLDQQAHASAEHLLLHFPEYPTAQTNAARVYLRLKRPDRALNLLLAALERGRLGEGDWAMLMKLTLQLDRDPARVMAALEQKHQQFPKLKSVRLLMLACLVRFGEYDAADQWLARWPDLAETEEAKAFRLTLRAFAPVEL